MSIRNRAIRQKRIQHKGRLMMKVFFPRETSTDKIFVNCNFDLSHGTWANKRFKNCIFINCIFTVVFSEGCIKATDCLFVETTAMIVGRTRSPVSGGTLRRSANEFTYNISLPNDCNIVGSLNFKTND